MSIGSIFLFRDDLSRKANRPRAALRCFERTLLYAADRSDDEYWEAAGYAGLCALRVAQRSPARAPALLPAARRWLRAAWPEAPEARQAVIEELLREAEAMNQVISASGQRIQTAASTAEAHRPPMPERSEKSM